MPHSAAGFIISLDFELHWGVRDRPAIEKYRNNLLGARQAIPAMLALFQEYGIHATWATVGLLFFETLHDLEQGLPNTLPKYERASLDPYKELSRMGRNEDEDPFHFAPSLIRQIVKHDGQEIGTHTFSHFYATMPGATLEAFRADLKSAKALATASGIGLKSIVFPNNRYAREHIRICAEEGLIAYRGTDADPWLASQTPLLNRAMRFKGAYAGRGEDGCFEPSPDAEYSIVSVSSSHFLRPWNRSLRMLETLRLKRICNCMSAAAKSNRSYHLWWHPHNFGANLHENLTFLTQILKHYLSLKQKFGWPSHNMAEAAEKAFRSGKH